MKVEFQPDLRRRRAYLPTTNTIQPFHPLFSASHQFITVADLPPLSFRSNLFSLSVSLPQWRVILMSEWQRDDGQLWRRGKNRWARRPAFWRRKKIRPDRTLRGRFQLFFNCLIVYSTILLMCSLDTNQITNSVSCTG